MDEKKMYEIKCNTCDEAKSVEINPNDLRRWKEGELIQEAMPYLDASQRELLVSGLCGECFDRIFAGVMQ
tara:strand:- start:891 stop:1100 length:210 start_codon:yes stop_codon:yes gene_type:complete